METEPGYPCVKEDLDATSSDELQANRHQPHLVAKEKHGEPASRAVRWWGHSETKPRDEFSVLLSSFFRPRLHDETGSALHFVTDANPLRLHSPHCHDKVNTRRNSRGWSVGAWV